MAPTGQVLRMKYNNGMVLRQNLDEILGAGTYKIKIRLNRWVVFAPRKLTKEEMDTIDNRMYQHYDRFQGQPGKK